MPRKIIYPVFALIILLAASCKKETTIIQPEPQPPQEKEITAYKDVITKIIGRWITDEVYIEFKDDKGVSVLKTTTTQPAYLTFYTTGRCAYNGSNISSGKYAFKKPGDIYILTLQRFSAVTSYRTPANAAFEVRSFTQNKLHLVNNVSNIDFYDPRYQEVRSGYKLNITLSLKRIF